MTDSPASMGQRLLRLMDHYRGVETGFNEQVVWRLPPGADPGDVAAVVTSLVARHESLRTTFTARGPMLRQLVRPPSPQPVHAVDVSAEATPQAAARRVLSREVSTPIDITQAPVRATLVRLPGDRLLLALTMHHFVTDDWSNGLISRDLRALYAQRTGRGPVEELPEIGWQYATWSDWHHAQLRGENLKVLTGYWRQQLSGSSLPDLSRLPAHARPARPQGTVTAEHRLGPEVAQELRMLARRNRSTLFPVLLSVFFVALQRRLGQRDLTVATLLAGRARPEVRDSVGFFAGMVLLRATLEEEAGFLDLVAQVRACASDAIRHQELPYQLLPPGTVDAHGGRADDVVFQLIGSFVGRADMTGDELDDLESQLETARFALEFVLVPQDDDLIALLMSTGERFTREWADDFTREYVQLCRAVVTQPSISLAQLCAPGAPPAPARSSSPAPAATTGA